MPDEVEDVQRAHEPGQREERGLELRLPAEREHLLELGDAPCVRDGRRPVRLHRQSSELVQGQRAEDDADLSNPVAPRESCGPHCGHTTIVRRVASIAKCCSSSSLAAILALAAVVAAAVFVVSPNARADPGIPDVRRARQGLRSRPSRRAATGSLREVETPRRGRGSARARTRATRRLPRPAVACCAPR